MHAHVSILRLLVVACLFTIGAATAFAELQAEVVKITGKAEYRIGPAAAWQELKEKIKLGEETAIRTQEGATVTIAIGAKGVVTVHELSTVTLATLKQTGSRGTVGTQGTGGTTTLTGGKEDTQINIRLEQGRLWNKLKKKEANDSTSMTISTPAAVASVRGTSFFVETDKDKTATIGVWEGRVEVESATLKGEHKAVEAGSRVIVLYNKPLTTPEKMQKEHLERQQQFEESMKGLGLLAFVPAVRGMAESNEILMNQAEDTVKRASLQQKGEKNIQEDFKKLKQALARLYADTGYFPGKGFNKAAGKKTLMPLVENKDEKGNPIPNWKGPYIDSDFKDPFGGSYTVYVKQTPKSSILMICSLGLDRTISEDDTEATYSLTALQRDAEDVKKAAK